MAQKFQMIGEIKEKEERLKRGHHAHNRMQKECEFFKDQMERAKRRQQSLNSHKDTQQAEIKKLESRTAKILEEEDRRKQQKKKYEETISERDVLGTQLIHRNDELALQYEKIKIQQRTLQNGELTYKQRLEESRALSIKLAQLKRELHIGKQQVLNIDDLKREVFQLQRELLQERTKVKALSEDATRGNQIRVAFSWSGIPLSIKRQVQFSCKGCETKKAPCDCASVPYAFTVSNIKVKHSAPPPSEPVREASTGNGGGGGGSSLVMTILIPMGIALAVAACVAFLCCYVCSEDDVENVRERRRRKRLVKCQDSSESSTD
eukprot:g16811.t1